LGKGAIKLGGERGGGGIIDRAHGRDDCGHTLLSEEQDRSGSDILIQLSHLVSTYNQQLNTLVSEPPTELVYENRRRRR